MGDFLQHPRIGAEDAGQAESPDNDPSDKKIEIMDGNGDFSKLSGFVARHKENIKTFTQYPHPNREIVCFL
jgi:hypothetical protein